MLVGTASVFTLLHIEVYIDIYLALEWVRAFHWIIIVVIDAFQLVVSYLFISDAIHSFSLKESGSGFRQILGLCKRHCSSFRWVMDNGPKHY